MRCTKIAFMRSNYLFFLCFEYYAGVDQSRRDKEMERLNECYSKIIAEKSDMKICLSHLISQESYRMLSGWTYSLKPESLRIGNRGLDLPEMTDVTIINILYFFLYIYHSFHISIFCSE